MRCIQQGLGGSSWQGPLFLWSWGESLSWSECVYQSGSSLSLMLLGYYGDISHKHNPRLTPFPVPPPSLKMWMGLIIHGLVFLLTNPQSIQQSLKVTQQNKRCSGYSYLLGSYKLQEFCARNLRQRAMCLYIFFYLTTLNPTGKGDTRFKSGSSDPRAFVLSLQPS